MTNEEAKQLKKGDKILIEAEVEFVYIDGDIKFSCKHTDCKGGIITRAYAVNPKNVTLMPEKPKYDHCRLFKKGDKVRVVERNGRSPILCGAVELGGTYTVYADEEDGDVMLDIGLGVGGGEPIAWYFLELVTPVEEIEPYYVKYTGTHYVVGKRPEEQEIVYLAEYSKDRHPHAKESAEAEADRLNAEWRKEQK